MSEKEMVSLEVDFVRELIRLLEDCDERQSGIGCRELVFCQQSLRDCIKKDINDTN